MDIVVSILMLAFIVLCWRLVCRWWVGRGGKRWVGHGLGFVFGPLMGLFVSIPMAIGFEGEKATGSSAVIGLVILGLFLFFEKKARSEGNQNNDEAGEEPSQANAVAASPSGRVFADSAGQAGSTADITFSLKETAEMILADDVVDQREAELLLKLLDKQDTASFDPACRQLHQVLIASLEDDVLDSSEAEEVKALLSEICDRPFERLEKSSSSKLKPAKTNKAAGSAPIKPKPKAPAKKKPVPKPKAKPAQPIFGDREPQIDEVLAFSYTDSKGDTSEREILFRSATRKDGRFYVKGICTARRAFRTFRGDRMEMLCFADTGEILATHG